MRLLQVLEFIWWNVVVDGIDSIEDARAFVRKASGLTKDERAILAEALRDPDRLRACHTALCHE